MIIVWGLVAIFTAFIAWVVYRIEVVKREDRESVQ
jgi:hypothetical protein